MKITEIQKIADDVRQRLLRASAHALPNNPSERGMKADDIRKHFYQSILNASDSLLSEQNRMADETNQNLLLIAKLLTALEALCGITENENGEPVSDALLTEAKTLVGAVNEVEEATKPIARLDSFIGGAKIAYKDLIECLNYYLNSNNRGVVGMKVGKLITEAQEAPLDDVDTFPVNTIYSFQGMDETKIKNLPHPYGTLMSFVYANSAANFAVQLFVTNTDTVYLRSRWGNAWRNWVVLPTLEKVEQLIAEIESVTVNVVHKTGTDENSVMSQKAISEILNKGEQYVEIPLAMTDGKFALANETTSSGAQGSTSGVQRSDFIPVNEGEKYRITTWAGVNVPAVVFYDEAMFSPGQYIGASYFVTTETFVNHYEFTIPGGCHHMVINARRSVSAFTPTMERIEVTYIKNIMDELKPYPTIKQKTIVNLGDSIFGNNISETSVSNILANRTGARVINCAFGGTRMTKRDTANGYDSFDFPSLVQAVVSEDFTVQDMARASYGLPANYKTNLQNLKSVDWEKVNVVTMNYGTNDYTANVPLETFKEVAINNIGALMAKYPHITFVLMTPTWRFWYNADGSYMEDGTDRVIGTNNLVAFCEASQEIAAALNINAIDVYNIGINKYNYFHYFNATDGTHHDVNGRWRLAEYIDRQLLKIL